MRVTDYFLTGTLAAALVLSGCKGKDKSAAGLLSSAAIKSEIKKNLTKAADVDPDKAQAALDFFKEEGISWQGVSGENGSYEFSNLTFADEDATIEKLTVSGLQMLDEDMPYASSVSIEGLSADDARIEEIVFNLPAKDTLRVLEDIEGGDPDALVESLMGSFMEYSGGGYIEGVSVSGEDQGSVDFIGWSKDAGLMSGLVEGMDFKIPENEGRGIIKIGHMSLKGMDVSGWNDGSDNTVASLMKSYMDVFNPYKRGYESMAIRDLEVAGTEDDMAFSFEIPRGDVWYTPNKGGVYHLKVDVPDIAVKFDADKMQDAEIPAAKIKEYGFDNISLKYWGDVRVDEKNDNLKLLTGGFAWKDNFELDMTYDADGMSAYYDGIGKLMGDMMPSISDPTKAPAINPAGLENQMMALMQDLVIKEFSVELRDQSLMEKGLEIASGQTGQSADDMKNAAKAMITMSTTQAPTEYTKTLSKDFMGMANSFIDNGGTMRMSMNPEGGLSVSQIINEFEKAGQNPANAMAAIDGVLKQLNVDFEHK